MNYKQLSGLEAGVEVLLLPEQRRFLQRGLPEEQHWNHARLYRVPSDVPAEVFGRALLAVIDHHDGLRTCLRTGHRDEFGLLTPVQDRFPVDQVDLSGLRGDPGEELTAHCTRVQKSMRMDAGPLLRLAHFRLPNDESRLLLVVHHFVCDGLSLGVLEKDFRSAYSALTDSGVPARGLVGTSVADHAEWLVRKARSDEILEQVPLWKELAPPTPQVSVDHAGENTMATTETVHRALDAQRTRLLFVQALPRLRVGPLDAVLTAAVLCLASADSGPTLRTNLIGHGRRGLPGQPDLANNVSWLSTRFPLSIAVPPRGSFASQVKEVLAQRTRVPFEGAGFGLLRYLSPDQQVRDSLAALGEPEVTVNFYGFQRPSGNRDGLRPAPESPGPEETETGIREHVHGIDAFVTANQLEVVWYYSSNQFDRATVESLTDELLDRICVGLKI